MRQSANNGEHHNFSTKCEGVVTVLADKRRNRRSLSRYAAAVALAISLAGLVPVAAQQVLGTQDVAAVDQQTPVTSDVALQGLDAYIEKARNEWSVPGTAVVIVKDDKVVYAKGFGVREIGKSGAVDADTIFAIGSASKAFTGASLAMLVDENKIAWDGVVHGYLPAFELHDAYATRNATVRDLLAHRTGFVSGYGWLWTGSGFTRDQIIRRLRFQTDSLGFRNRFSYANEMYTAAGEIIPAVTGTSWDDFVAQRLFTPLGMSRSHTSVTALGGLKNVASPHGLVDGTLVSFPYRQVNNVGGAGAINSSARDMAQWVRLQLNDGVYDGQRLISSASLTETHTGQIVPRGGALANPGGMFAEYGFGWILGDYRGRKVIQHGGGVDGMLCVVSMMPEEKLGVVVLTNMLPHQLHTAVELRVFDAFLGGAVTDWSATLKAKEAEAKALGEASAASQSPPSPGPLLPLSRYAGTYSSDLYGMITVAENGGTLTLTRPTATAVLTPETANLFKARWTSASILSVYGETMVGFNIGPAGTVQSLELGPDLFKREAAAVDSAGR